MTTIKKFIAGVSLTLLFAASALAENITTIAIKMNECFSLMENIARYEYENSENFYENTTKETDQAIQKYVAFRLNSFSDIVLECDQAKIPSFKKFTEKTVDIACDIKISWLNKFASDHNNYKIDYNKSLHKPDVHAKCFAARLDNIVMNIYEYLSEENEFSEQQYKDFAHGFKNNELLTEDHKKALFDLLVKCKIEKQ